MGRGEGTYPFLNAREMQRKRLAVLATLLDPGTTALLESLGVGPRWRCLEVGAGGGSIAEWLCDRVAADGWVLATDLDTTVLADLQRPNLEVLQHDILRDGLPEGQFDLAHVRLLLAWLADPGAALRRIVGALKPRGLVLVEEMDFISVAPDPRLDIETRSVFAHVVDAHLEILARSHSFNPFYGRRAAGDLAKAGLVNIGSAGRLSMWQGGAAGGQLLKLTLVQLRDEMVAAGLAAAEQIDIVIELCEDTNFSFMSQITMAAWGRPRLT